MSAGWMICGLISASGNGFFSSPKHFQPPIQWAPGTLSLGEKPTVHEVHQHLCLLLRKRMSGVIFLFLIY